MKVLCPANDIPFSPHVRLTRDLGGIHCELAVKSTWKDGRFYALMESKFRDPKGRNYIRQSDLNSHQQRNHFFTGYSFHGLYTQEEILKMESKSLASGCLLNQVNFMDQRGQLWSRSLTTLNQGKPWIGPMTIAVEFHPDDDAHRFWSLLEKTSWRTREHLRNLLAFVPVQRTSGRPAVHKGKIAFSAGKSVYYTRFEDLINEYAVANLITGVVTSFGGVAFLPVVELPMPVIGIDGNMKGEVAATFMDCRGVLTEHITLATGIHGELRTPETLHEILNLLEKRGRLSRDLPFLLHVDGKFTGPMKRAVPGIISRFPLVEIVELPKYVSPLIGRETGDGVDGDYVILSDNQGVVVANAQMNKIKCPAGTFVQKVHGGLSVYEHLSIVYQLCHADPLSLFHTPSVPSSVRLAMDKIFLARNLLRAYQHAGIVVPADKGDSHV